jgi:hypothetical protein
MGAFKAGTVSLSSQTAKEKRDYLDARCARGNWARAAAISEIFDFWLAMGAPPLAPNDDGHIALPVPDKASVEVKPHWRPYIRKAPGGHQQQTRALSGPSRM